MHLFKLLFSHRNKISRLGYLIGVLFTYSIVALLFFGSSYLQNIVNLDIFRSFLAICIILYFYWGMAITAKRLRDAHLPSGLVYLIFIPLIDAFLKLFLILVPSRMDTIPVSNQKFVQKPLKFSEEYRKLHIRPCHRLFAKLMDIVFTTIILSILLFGFYPSLNDNSSIHKALIGLAGICCWFLLEPFFLASWGSTLGKYIFNIKIRDRWNQKPKFRDALIRSFKVWIKGCACGIKLISLFALVAANAKLIKTGTTSWDEDKFIVTHHKIGVIRYSIIILFFIIYLSAVIADMHF